MDVVWAALLALIFWALRKDLRGAVVVWVGVVSHWLFDWIDYHFSRILTD